MRNICSRNELLEPTGTRALGRPLIRGAAALALLLAAAGSWGCGASASTGGGGQAQCAASVARATGDPYVTGRHPRFPGNRYITAAAESCQDARDADVEAQAEVSRQVRSDLESNFTTFTRQWREETLDSERLKFVERILSKTSTRTSFSQAHLIKIVLRDNRAGVFRSFAALDRARTAQVLSPAVESARGQVEQRMEHCLKAYQGGDLKGLQRMTPQVVKAIQLYDQRLNELAMIKGDFAMYASRSPLKLLATLERYAWSLRQGRRWYVTVSGEQAETQKAARMLLPAVGNVLRGKGQKVAAWPPGVADSADDVSALASHLGDAAAASYVMAGKFQVETEPQPMGGGQFFHICVCKLALAGRHVGTGRAVMQKEIESERKGGGDTVAQACERCAEYLKASVARGF